MSLHLANLSPHIRKDELERVFRRFGRCTVQLKDGYGFAVYEFRGDAEKALRTLKGRKISGESVYLSWSNKQPKPLQKFARAARSPGRPYRRNSDRSDYFVGRNIMSRGDYSMSDKKQPGKGRERHKSSEVHDDRSNFNLNDSGHVQYDEREVVLEQAGRIDVEPNLLDNGRWEERSDNLQNGTDLDGQMGFDRYKPDFGAERVENYESYLPDKQSVGTSPEKNRRVHRDKKRGQQTCFKCGAAGHKMRDCRLEENLQENSTYQSDYGHDAIDKIGVGRTDSESRSRGWLRSNSRNSRSARLLDTNRKLSYSGKGAVDGRSLPMENNSGRDIRKDSNKKRRREMNDHFVETYDDKKSTVLDLSHRHSDYISPELGTCSESLKPSLGLTSHSRSGSHIPHPLSVSSRSISKSRRSRSISRSSRSRSRNLKSKSRSRSPSSSLSISLGRSLPSSPKKAEVNFNGLSEGALDPQPKEELTEVRERLELEGREENLCIGNRVEMHLNGHTDNAKSSQLMEVLIESKQSEHDSQTQTSAKNTEINLNGFMEDDQILQYQEALPEERQQGPETMQDNELPQTDVRLLSEDVSSSGKVICDMKLDQLHNDGGSDSTIPNVSFGIEAPCSSLLEKDDQEFADANMAAEKQREIVELENGNALEMTKPLEPANNSDLKAPSKLHAGSHLNISAEELSRVLKHYGLEHPEENIQYLDVGDYFGSSRLWPWEMIYYRRLKKGPISIENYARRVAQNKAFSITDKYVRSSSGWGELTEEHC